MSSSLHPAVLLLPAAVGCYKIERSVEYVEPGYTTPAGICDLECIRAEHEALVKYTRTRLPGGGAFPAESVRRMDDTTKYGWACPFLDPSREVPGTHGELPCRFGWAIPPREAFAVVEDLCDQTAEATAIDGVLSSSYTRSATWPSGLGRSGSSNTRLSFTSRDGFMLRGTWMDLASSKHSEITACRVRPGAAPFLDQNREHLLVVLRPKDVEPGSTTQIRQLEILEVGDRALLPRRYVRASTWGAASFVIYNFMKMPRGKAESAAGRAWEGRPEVVRVEVRDDKTVVRHERANPTSFWPPTVATRALSDGKWATQKYYIGESAALAAYSDETVAQMLAGDAPAPPPSPTPAPAAPSSGGLSVEALETLQKLKELQDAGVITAEEFEAKKKEILGL